MAPLDIHAKALYDDLDKLANGGAEQVGQPLANVYNVLLAQAKKLRPQDELLKALEPVGDGIDPRVLCGLAGQIYVTLAN
jgi:hypothetical protein